MPRLFVMVTGLFLLTVAIYWPVYRFGFVDYDDSIYITDNPNMHRPFHWDLVKEAFTTCRTGNYEPVSWLSYYADKAMFNLRPGPMHDENVILHLINGLLLWQLLWAVTGKPIRSYVVAALFLCHPLHVESVAWISERKDVLSTAWLLVAISAYVRFCKLPAGAERWVTYTLMLVCFALSLLSKAMGITLPGVLLLMDFWPLQRWPKKSWAGLVVEKLPILLMAATMAVVAASAQVQAGAAPTLRSIGPFERIGNAMVSYWLYTFKLAVPTDLAVVYPFPGPRPLAAVFAAGVLLAMVTVFFNRVQRRKPYLIVGWLWFLGALLPVSGLLQVGSTAMTDRYSYLPSIGIFIAAIWFVSDALPAAVGSAAAGIVILVFSVLAHRQVLYWRDTRALFGHAVELIDHNPVAHVALARVAYNTHDFHTAIDECNLALRDGPDASAYVGLGNCWLLEDLPKAIQLYRAAVKVNPEKPDPYLALASGLQRQGKWAEAENEVRIALQLKPDSEPAKEGLADILAKRPTAPPALEK